MRPFHHEPGGLESWGNGIVQVTRKRAVPEPALQRPWSLWHGVPVKSGPVMVWWRAGAGARPYMRGRSVRRWFRQRWPALVGWRVGHARPLQRQTCSGSVCSIDRRVLGRPPEGRAAHASPGAPKARVRSCVSACGAPRLRVPCPVFTRVAALLAYVLEPVERRYRVYHLADLLVGHFRIDRK